MQVFLRILKIGPEVKRLFKVENVRHSQLARNAIIQAHGKRFIIAVGSIILRLDNNNGDTEDNTSHKILFDLGQQPLT